MDSTLEYNPYSGILSKAGHRVCRSDMTKGYLRVFWDGKYHKAHRVAWFLTYGEWPKGQIDHIDGDKTNNRINNLRDVTQTVNMYNQTKAHKHNKTGVLGVGFNGYSYQAKIRIGNKLKYLGSYATKEEASRAYQTYKNCLDTSS